jgi:hypothetical protein
MTFGKSADGKSVTVADLEAAGVVVNPQAKPLTDEIAEIYTEKQRFAVSAEMKWLGSLRAYLIAIGLIKQ